MKNDRTVSTYLQEEKWRVPQQNETESKSLKGLSIIPTSDGKLASVAGMTVYLPVTAAEALASEHASLLGGLGTALFLNTDLYHLLEGRRDVFDWVKRNLAGLWTPDAYCRDLVKGISASVTRLAVTDLVQATKLVRDLVFSIKQGNLRELCIGLPLRLQDGTVATIQRHNGKELVTPANLEPETGWQIVFPDAADRQEMCIVSDCYLERCNDFDERKRWVDFFAEIGVTSAPVAKRTWKFDDRSSPPNDMPEDLRTQVRHFVRTSTKGRDHRLIDIRVPGWLGGADLHDENSPVHRQQSRALIIWLQRVWHRVVRSSAQFEWFRNKNRTWNFDSHLPYALHTIPWFLSTQGFRRPGEVFLDRTETREIFGDTVPYATDSIEQELAEWLGVRTSATVEEVLKYLQALAERPAEEMKKSLAQRIYFFLMERWRDNEKQREDGKNIFATNALIRIESPTPRWIRIVDAIWTDRSNVFGKDFAYLEPEHPSRLREFFVEQLGINLDVEDKLYARSWFKHQEEEGTDPKRVEAALERIFPVLKRVAEADTDTQEEWWHKFLSGAKVWTQDDRFLPPSDVFVPDDGALKKVMDSADVPFAWRPSKDSFVDHQALYQVLGVRSLVESTQCELGVDIKTTDVPKGEERFLTDAAKRGVCFYLWHTAKDEYERLRANDTLAVLLAASEAKVDRLDLVYTLEKFRIVDDNAVAYFDRKVSKLYLSVITSYEEQAVETPALIARFMTRGWTNRSLEDFLRGILGQSDRYLDILSQKNDWRLPLEEREWVEQAIAGQLDWFASATDDEESEEDENQNADPQEDKNSSVVAEDGELQPFIPFEKSDDEAVASLTENDWVYESQTVQSHGDQTRGLSKDQSKIILGPATTQLKLQEQGTASTEIPNGPSRTLAVSSGELPAEPHSNGRPSVNPMPSSSNQNRDPAVEQAGIEAVVAYERMNGREPHILEHNHPGWDISSFEHMSPQDLDPDRYIEVKARRDVWDNWGVVLTRNEYENARRYGTAYYLYVVEYALDADKQQIYVFRDPAAKIGEYSFSNTWRSYADETAASPMSSHEIEA